MNKKYSHYQLKKTNLKGFTLIELLITLFIMVLLLAVGIPAFRNFGLRNDLNQSAEEVKNAILETQSLALAPSSSKDPVVTEYSISFLKDESQFVTSENYPGDENYKEISKHRLANNISFISNSVSIAFAIGQQAKITKPNSEEILIQIKHQQLKDDNIKNIKVNRATGSVNVE